MPQISWQRHALAIACLITLIIACYFPAINSYYCSFDDYSDWHRAYFEDRENPTNILTTSHRGGGKYRPLHRLANDLSSWWGNEEPSAFRIRNLTFHVLSAASVYALGLLLFTSWPIAIAAALLFAVHPLAHQSVIPAGFTNAAPNGLFLLSLAAFLAALRYPRRVRLLCFVCLLSATLGLYAYEPALVVFGLFYLYLGLHFLFTRKLPSLKFLIPFTVAAVLCAGSYFVARAVLVPEAFAKNPMTPIPVALKNLVMFLGALSLPFDSILAHDLLGTPLPRDLQFNAKLFLMAGLGAALLLAVVFAFRRRILSSLEGLNWIAIYFLFLALVSSLSLFLIFTDHASETYLALPSAFASLLAAAFVGTALRKPPGLFPAWVIVAVLLGALASINRSQHLNACGDTGRRLIADLPADLLRSGPVTVWLSPTPGQAPTRPYGIYFIDGYSALGPNSQTLQIALQVTFHNPDLVAQLLSPVEITARASQPTTGHLFYFVNTDGTLAAVKP